ncbi:MAG: calcium/sodium antiporter [Paludibacter sp.]|nr:calcium/sodium antiporter [Paludibacter sp.]
MDYLFILFGFGILIIGANYLVEGASGLAKRFNVPDLVIGLTVVALGTSAPELVVNLVAAASPETTDLALTNIIGSNTINTFIVLGLAALILPIKSQKSSRRFDIPLSLLGTLLILFFAIVFDNFISRIDGLILLLFFAWFMLVMVTRSIKNSEIITAEIHFKPMKIWIAGIMILGGLGALIGGAGLIVPSAVCIAQSLGISQSVIGLTIVALGTSLPELATSVVAAFKKNSDIALGNVIGSNIFNVFFVLSVSAMIRPLPAYDGMIIDLSMAALGSLLVMVFVLTNKQFSIKRWQGGLLLSLYFIYIFQLITKSI